MNIVLICGGYYPNFSATGNCIRQIANGFIREGINTVVVSKSTDGDENSEYFEGQKIYRVTDKRIRDFIKIKKLNQNSIYGKAKVTIIKSYWAIKLLLSESGMDEALVKAYVRKLETLDSSEIDAVMPCCMPVEAVKAGYIFCTKYNIPFFPILYDRYSENKDYFRFSWNHKLRYKKADKLEDSMFDSSAMVFYVDNWSKYFARKKRDNALRVEHPLVVNRKRDPLALNNATSINAIYQGEINHQMRPPQAMLAAFESIVSNDESISLHVFASGNGVAEVKKSADAHPGKIQFYGKVSKELADRYYDFADITIILANRDKEIVSSKIFESVASGYPIIYFYFSEDEMSYELLKKYPLVLFVRQDQIDNDECKRIIAWMHNNKNKRVKFDLVRELYSDATPDLIVDTVMDIIGK